MRVFVCLFVCMYIYIYIGWLVCTYVCIMQAYVCTYTVRKYARFCPVTTEVAIEFSYSGGCRLKSQHGDQTTEVLTCLPQSSRQSWKNCSQLGHGQCISNCLLMVLISDAV
jgi:hypothetical protein